MALEIQGQQTGVLQREDVRRKHDRRLKFVKFVELINQNEEREYRSKHPPHAEVTQQQYLEQLEALFQRAQDSQGYALSNRVPDFDDVLRESLHLHDSLKEVSGELNSARVTNEAPSKGISTDRKERD